MLASMKSKTRLTLEGLNRLRVESDPKFRADLTAIADSLQGLLESTAKGGNARAKKLTKKRRKEIATKAANARWGGK